MFVMDKMETEEINNVLLFKILVVSFALVMVVITYIENQKGMFVMSFVFLCLYLVITLCDWESWEEVNDDKKERTNGI